MLNDTFKSVIHLCPVFMKTTSTAFKLFLLGTVMTTISLMTVAQDISASTEKKTFSRTTTVSTVINADITEIWSLLTTANNYPNWNSTVVSIEGNIAEGEKIKLVSTLDTSRTFKLKVKEATPYTKLTWGDGLGNRTYDLFQTEEGVLFVMTEKIGGFMFPLFAKKIPSFDDSFEQFAGDLKAEAERVK